MRRLGAETALLLLGAAASPARAEQPAVAAILSSESRAYQDALGAFKLEYKDPVAELSFSDGEPRIPPSARVVVTFGSKAAAMDLPEGVRQVYALAPGVTLEPPAIKVWMAPRPGDLLDAVLRVDRRVRVVGVLWGTLSSNDYAAKLERAASQRGLVVTAVDVDGTDGLPEALRTLHARGVGAIWLPPDPRVLTKENLRTLTDFSNANRVPLLVPTAGLLTEGATAAVGVTFRECGRTAAQAAREALSGAALPPDGFWAEQVDVAVSRSAAERVGLPLDAGALGPAGRVEP